LPLNFRHSCDRLSNSTEQTVHLTLIAAHMVKKLFVFYCETSKFILALTLCHMNPVCTIELYYIILILILSSKLRPCLQNYFELWMHIGVCVWSIIRNCPCDTSFIRLDLKRKPLSCHCSSVMEMEQKETSKEKYSQNNISGPFALLFSLDYEF
jgi:hypothetical protein